MPLSEDLNVLNQQEQQLRFPNFNCDTAWKLGSSLREAFLALGAGGSVQIEVANHLLFACATRSAPPGQADWIRRKRNVVQRFARSSYAVGLALEDCGETLESRHGLKLCDYVAHGGGFPILLENTGPIGSVVVSGLPQRDDHNLVVNALASVLGKNVPRLR